MKNFIVAIFFIAIITIILPGCSLLPGSTPVSNTIDSNTSSISNISNGIATNESNTDDTTNNQSSGDQKESDNENVIENIIVEKTDYSLLMDRIIAPSDFPLTFEDVEIPGSVEVNQIVGSQHIKITEIVNFYPNLELAITARSSSVLQGATYEVRTASPIILKDGTRLAFHAYVISYQWERDAYLKAMEPSPHNLYVIAEDGTPDYLDLIGSGLAESTSQDLIRKGDTLVTLDDLNKEKKHESKYRC